MTESKEIELQNKVNKGVLAQDFLVSQFFKLVLKPYWEDRARQLNVEFLYPENKENLEKIGIKTLFNAGRLAEIYDLEVELNRWVEQGHEAQKELNRVNSLSKLNDSKKTW